MITQHLEKYDIHTPLDQLSNTIQDQLIEIEKYFQNHIDEQIELLEKLKHQKINLAKVCTATKIPRSSVYNSPDILKKYINKRIDEIVQTDLLSLNKSNKFNEDYGFLKRYLENIKIQIIENDIFELKIQGLEKEITDLNHINRQYALEISKLYKENENLKFQLIDKKSNVIKFNDYS